MQFNQSGSGAGSRITPINYDPNNYKGPKRKLILSSSQLSGLLEVEPLTFTCIAASENVKVESETGISHTSEILIIN